MYTGLKKKNNQNTCTVQQKQILNMYFSWVAVNYDTATKHVLPFWTSSSFVCIDNVSSDSIPSSFRFSTSFSK